MIKTQWSVIKGDEQTIFQGGKKLLTFYPLAIELSTWETIWLMGLSLSLTVSDWIFEADPTFCLFMHSSNWHE